VRPLEGSSVCGLLQRVPWRWSPEGGHLEAVTWNGFPRGGSLRGWPESFPGAFVWNLPHGRYHPEGIPWCLSFSGVPRRELHTRLSLNDFHGGCHRLAFSSSGLFQRIRLTVSPGGGHWLGSLGGGPIYGSPVGGPLLDVW
jgi:hypothetical protein